MVVPQRDLAVEGVEVVRAEVEGADAQLNRVAFWQGPVSEALDVVGARRVKEGDLSRLLRGRDDLGLGHGDMAAGDGLVEGLRKVDGVEAARREFRMAT